MDDKFINLNGSSPDGCEKCNLANELLTLRKEFEDLLKQVEKTKSIISSLFQHCHTTQTRIDNGRRIQHYDDIDGMVNEHGKEKVVAFLIGQITEL